MSTTATFTFKDDPNTVDVVMVYNYVLSNTWSCAVGMLPDNSGTWTSSGVANRVILNDSTGAQMAYMDGVPVHGSIGYPFDPADSGASGAGMVLSPTASGIGAASSGVFGWTLDSA